MAHYHIHTDGAYSRKHDEGAYAFVICDSENKELYRESRKITKETNQRAELKAIILAVYRLPEDAESAEIHSDSRYALNTLSGEWARNANIDLFESWNNKVLNRRENLKLTYSWVKGHNGDYYNELCDRLCNETLGYNPSDEYAKYKKN